MVEGNVRVVCLCVCVWGGYHNMLDKCMNKLIIFQYVSFRGGVDAMVEW